MHGCDIVLADSHQPTAARSGQPTAPKAWPLTQWDNITSARRPSEKTLIETQSQLAGTYPPRNFSGSFCVSDFPPRLLPCLLPDPMVPYSPVLADLLPRKYFFSSSRGSDFFLGDFFVIRYPGV